MIVSVMTHDYFFYLNKVKYVDSSPSVLFNFHILQLLILHQKIINIISIKKLIKRPNITQILICYPMLDCMSSDTG